MGKQLIRVAILVAVLALASTGVVRAEPRVSRDGPVAPYALPTDLAADGQYVGTYGIQHITLRSTTNCFWLPEGGLGLYAGVASVTPGPQMRLQFYSDQTRGEAFSVDTPIVAGTPLVYSRYIAAGTYCYTAWVTADDMGLGQPVAESLARDLALGVAVNPK